MYPLSHLIELAEILVKSKPFAFKSRGHNQHTTWWDLE